MVYLIGRWLMDLVKCNKCKWVHFEVEEIPLNSQFPTPDYPPPVPKKCFRCGGSYKDFSTLTPEDHRPNGSTIQSIKKRST